MNDSSNDESHVYTLLIVESPTVANIIDKLSIPYLNVIATEGYCWIPRFDRQHDKLRIKADPEKRDIRNRIRDQSRWATQVIISTDFDASGDAIAYGLASQLKRYDVTLRRSPLQGLSRKALNNTLSQAVPFEKDVLTHRMENRFRLQQGLQGIWVPIESDFLLTILGLLNLFLNTEKHTLFIDESGQSFQSATPLNVKWQGSFQVRRTGTIETRYHEIPPLSTPDALSLARQKGREDRYEDIQNDLNTLFTSIPESLKAGLISYPRTAARGYYRTTWNQAKKFWSKNHETESFRPFLSQSRVKEDTPHEAIHPLNEQNTPSAVRPFIKKKYYDLYRHIYDHHLKVIQMPASLQLKIFKSSKDNKFFKCNARDSNNRANSGKCVRLTPCMTLSDLMQRMFNHNLASPSKAGSCMDALVENQWVQRAMGENIEPGSRLYRVGEQIKNPHALKQLIKYINKEAAGYIDADQISGLLREAFGDR